MKHSEHIIEEFIEAAVVEQINEVNISAQSHHEINQLLSLCFKGYPKDKSFFKQLPHFRLLLRNHGKLIGQLAIDHRMISVGTTPFRVLGLSDLCIDPNFQANRLASRLLRDIEKIGRRSEADFLILFTNQQGFYLKNGFKIVDNDCRWVFINADQTLGVSQRNLGKTIMIKPIASKKWGDGILDLMGHIF